MCRTAMLARASLLLCLVVGTLQLSITELKVPAALESGENAVLQCWYDVTGEPNDEIVVKWWWTSHNTSEISQIYQRIGTAKGAPMQHNVEAKDNDTIVLLETTPADSGVYECDVTLMSEKVKEVRQHQELTIYTQGSGPNVTISEVADGPDEDTENDLLVECRAEGVAPEPDIELKVNGKKLNMTEYITGPDSDGLYDIFGNATLSKDGDVDRMEVHCELFYVNENVSHPQYFDVKIYEASGALNATDAPRNASEPDLTPDSFQNPSGDSSQCCLSWILLFALGLLTQVFALESSM